MDQELVKNNIEKIQQRIYQICKKHNKNPTEIKLIAVSKFQSIENIKAAYHVGIRDFAENYIQEWQTKSTQLSHLKDIRWHIIGNVQSNKAKFLNENTFCLQSLDSLDLAKEIEKRRITHKPLNALIQLKVDFNDTNKSGASYEKAKILGEFIAQSPKFNLCGFMGIGPQTQDNIKLKLLYQKFIENCEYLWDYLKKSCIQSHNFTYEKKIISLGMSQDLEIAIECGSNMVRIGSAIFGSRN